MFDMWTTWWERNCCTFEDMETAATQLVALFHGFLCDWSRARGCTSMSSIPEFILYSSFLFVHKIYSVLFFSLLYVLCTCTWNLFAIKHILLIKKRVLCKTYQSKEELLACLSYGLFKNNILLKLMIWLGMFLHDINIL